MFKRCQIILLVALLSIAILFTVACSGGVKAKSGDTVKVDYTGKLSDGTVFDSSIGKQPLEFTLGAKQVIVGFENAVIGMKVGESKTVTIPVDEAYGRYRDDLVFTVNRSELPEGLEPQVGQQLTATNTDGSTTIVTIIEVSEETVTIDANHTLAGKDLTFEITLVEINPE
jgi:FKBP-type peptidyl-prolyl cis-trans isomerase 2